MKKSRKRKKKYIINNLLSILGLILFVAAELLYFNIFISTGFREKVDNLPRNIKYVLDNSICKKDNDSSLEKYNSMLMSSDEDNTYELQPEDKKINSDIESSIIESSIIDSIESVDALNTLDTTESLIDVLADFTSDTQLISESATEIKKYKYETVQLDYFSDALFVGDSRMAGFEIYKKIPGAMYFCYSSASVFNIFENEDEVSPVGKVKLFDLLSQHKFGKIYIMLGINNLQTNYYNHKKQYKETLDLIKKLQPNAIIYLIANLHVTDVYDPAKPHLTNENINLVNKFIESYADNINVFYLDPNGMYDDENGNLRLELSTDNVHIHVTHYDKFLVYLLSNALVEDNDSPKIIGPMR